MQSHQPRRAVGPHCVPSSPRGTTEEAFNELGLLLFHLFSFLFIRIISKPTAISPGEPAGQSSVVLACRLRPRTMEERPLWDSGVVALKRQRPREPLVSPPRCQVARTWPEEAAPEEARTWPVNAASISAVRPLASAASMPAPHSARYRTISE